MTNFLVSIKIHIVIIFFHSSYSFLPNKSYLTDHYFQIQYSSSTSEISKINAGVPLGGILNFLIFKIFTVDQPAQECQQKYTLWGGEVNSIRLP